ncbi:MAG: 30S ribosomal protein S20 [Selenomonadaceae bacterium]|nr:30S ribosomal protein S20 [Selenomonadaceae bacterium]
MPNIRSSKKSIRKDQKRRARNLLAKANIKKAQKKVLAAIANNDAAEAKNLLPLAVKAYDKAVASNTIHKNAAARKKSKLAKKVNTLGA